MEDTYREMIHSSLKMRDLSEKDLITILGFYIKGQKSIDEVYSLLEEFKNPGERDKLSLPIEESLFPEGVKDVLSDLYTLGAATWQYYRIILYEIMCNKDGTCKYKYDFGEFENLIVTISGIEGMTMPIAICLLLLIYKKGYPKFCQKIPT